MQNKTIFLNKIKNIKTLWGVDLNFENFQQIKHSIKTFKSQGFHGVEIATGFFDHTHKTDFLKILSDEDMKIITQIHTDGYPIKSNDPTKHLEDLKYKIEESLTWNPILINCHSGTDIWDLQQNIDFFRKAHEFTSKISTTVCHETHRQRALFNHYNTYQILTNFPQINLNLDLSHWVIGSERLISKESDYFFEELKKILIKNVFLIHARIGSCNMIQLTDPSLKENKLYEDYFHGIWREIIQKSEKKVIYLTYEYGPEPYLFVDYIGGKVCKDIEEVILDQKKRFEDFLV